MSWEKVNAEIDKIRHIVEGWERSGKIDVIDQEVVLDKLRLVYEQVKFADLAAAAQKDGPQQAEPAAGQPVPAAAAAETEPVQNSAPAGKTTPAEEAVVSEQAPRPEPPKEEAPEPAVSAHAAESGEEAMADSPEEKLAVMDDLLLRPKRDRKAIMSLYGDKEEPAKEGREAVFTPEPIGETAGDDDLGNDVLGAISLDESSQTPVKEERKEEAPAAPGTAATPRTDGGGASGQDTKKVLGETIRPGETLSDMYARSNNRQDVAGRINSGKLGSIRSAVGINDKFLLIRDLFGGDAAKYDKTMAELDAFTDLDDALLYIHDNFRWNPDSDGVKLLMDLLTRKL